MGAPGINLVETRFPVKVARPQTEDGQPDIADIIYGVHCCNHGHGDELPNGFELISDAAGPPHYTRFLVEKGEDRMSGKVRLSDRIIFGLIAVAVLFPKNCDQRVPDGYHLTFGGHTLFSINDWWGRAEEFVAIVSRESLPNVKSEFGKWM